MDKLKSIYFGFITLAHTIVSLFLVFIFNKKGIARKLKEMCKDRNGRPATILANGPSLKHILDNKRHLLEDSDVLVLNNFGNQEVFFELRPTYYIVLDPAYYDINFRVDQEINADMSRSAETQLMANLNKVDWPMTLLIPQKALQIFQAHIKNDNIRFAIFQTTRVLGYDGFQNWMYKHNQGVPSSRNVVFPAMINLINMGYKSIYLYGMEFSWLKNMEVDPSNGLIIMNDNHFYSKDEIRHFGKGYYKRMLNVMCEDINATDQIAKYALYRNVKMINRTIGSFVDSFEYENPDTL